MATSQSPLKKTPTKSPKSILKKTSRSTQEPEDAKAKRNRELAIHHALLIEHQKGLEMQILESIEALIDYPKRAIDPQNPNPIDASEVKSHLRLFRPSDFDSAVQERNVVEECGYMLCPKKPHKQDTTAKFRIIRAQNIRVVKKEDLEKWCSDDCAKRALYLRVQLSDTPAWERASTEYGGLILYGEHESHKLAQREEVDGLTRDLDQLALERGDDPQSFRSKGMEIEVNERPMETLSPPEAPSGDSDTPMLIEGFLPGSTSGRRRDVLDSNILNDLGDILDTI